MALAIPSIPLLYFLLKLFKEVATFISSLSAFHKDFLEKTESLVHTAKSSRNGSYIIHYYEDLKNSHMYELGPADSDSHK